MKVFYYKYALFFLADLVLLDYFGLIFSNFYYEICDLDVYPLLTPPGMFFETLCKFFNVLRPNSALCSYILSFLSLDTDLNDKSLLTSSSFLVLFLALILNSLYF